MAEFDNRYGATTATTRSGAAVDEGLRSYMLGVYNYMAGGVALTGVMAYMVSAMAVQNGQLTDLGQALYNSPLKWVLAFAPLGFVLLLGFRVHKMSPAATQAAFWGFAALMGVSLSSIFLIFNIGSIAQIFFITAAAFAGLSIWGYTTKKDISGWGSFLIMGVIGIIVAAVVNIFLQSGPLQWAISIVTLLVFAGLTAYDNQRIKDEYLMLRNDATMLAKASVMGALSLYINFINMFMAALQLFGSRE